MANKTKIILGILAVVLLGALSYTYLKAPTTGALDAGSPITITDADWAQNAPGAKVTLLEYADYQCPACAAYHPLLQKLKNEYKDRINFVFRVFPLPMHVNAVPAAVAAEAAGLQGKYFEMADKLFTNQQAWESSTTANDFFVTYATELGLDIEKFKIDIANQDLKQKVVQSFKNGSSAKVNSTPTFFINGVKIKNPIGSTDEEVLKGFRELLDAELVKLGEPSNVISTSTNL